jgi:serine/threonine protein kinase
MSPERLDDKPYDGRADVYSVGMMLYQMLCGRLPFQAEDGNLWGVVFMHLTKDPPPLREFNPNIPAEVEAVIMRALEKDPEKRPTAREFAMEFTKAAGIELEMLSSGTFRLATSGQGVTTTPTVETGSQKTVSIKGDTGEVKEHITNPAE